MRHFKFRAFQTWLRPLRFVVFVVVVFLTFLEIENSGYSSSSWSFAVVRTFFSHCFKPVFENTLKV